MELVSVTKMMSKIHTKQGMELFGTSVVSIIKKCLFTVSNSRACQMKKKAMDYSIVLIGVANSATWAELC